MRSAEEMSEGMRDNVKPGHPAEDIIWWQIDENHHQSVIIYSSEDAAKKHRAEVEKLRASSSKEYSIKLKLAAVSPLHGFIQASTAS